MGRSQPETAGAGVSDTSFPDRDAAFIELIERHRGELGVHCYRMLGSFDDTEDLLEQTILRAGRDRVGLRDRAWLYRTATSACLDFLDRHPRSPAARASGNPPAIWWLQPFPDRLLENTGEAIELAFVAAVQYLPDRQRAVLLLRDVLGWSGADTAACLDMDVPAVKDLLRQARTTLRAQLPRRHTDRALTADSSGPELELLRLYIHAHERADAAAMEKLLCERVWLTMPPPPRWIIGRANVAAHVRITFAAGSPIHAGQWRGLLTRANRQPAVAGYFRLAGRRDYHPQMLSVLRIQDGLIAEINEFEPNVFPSFGFPPSMP